MLQCKLLHLIIVVGWVGSQYRTRRKLRFCCNFETSRLGGHVEGQRALQNLYMKPMFEPENKTPLAHSTPVPTCVYLRYDISGVGNSLSSDPQLLPKCITSVKLQATPHGGMTGTHVTTRHDKESNECCWRMTETVTYKKNTTA